MSVGYEGQTLQDFVKQQQDLERAEMYAEREFKKARLAAKIEKIAGL